MHEIIWGGSRLRMKVPLAYTCLYLGNKRVETSATGTNIIGGINGEGRRDNSVPYLSSDLLITL